MDVGETPPAEKGGNRQPVENAVLLEFRQTLRDHGKGQGRKNDRKEPPFHPCGEHSRIPLRCVMFSLSALSYKRSPAGRFSGR